MNILAAGVILAELMMAPASAQPAVRDVPGKEFENFPDGSSGRVVEFRAPDGSFIPAYMRRPKSSGKVPGACQAI